MSERRHCTMDFKSLISPTNLADFFAQYWEIKPLIINRKFQEYYESLISSRDLDFLISAACASQNGSLDIISSSSAGAKVESRDAGSVDAAHRAYRAGATLRVKHAQRYWKPLHLLCSQLEQLFSFPIKTNLYCTPGAQQGLTRHWDTHDVLVLQISGRKRWRLFNPVVSLPLANLPPLSFERSTDNLKYYRGGSGPDVEEFSEETESAAAAEFVLEPGDLLYMPRGFVHEACAQSEGSAHLTIGIHVLTCLDLLAVALGQVANLNERLRKALPVGFANESATPNSQPHKEWFDTLLQAFAQSADLKSALDEIAGSFFHSRQALADGSLTNGEDINGIDVNTLLHRRPGLLCRLVVEEQTITLLSPQSAVSLPRAFESALRFIAQALEFRVSEIPGGLSDPSRVALVRRLVQQDFLNVSSD
jgi:ribosomal protein L16 Arg81 hydroxylase